MGNLAGYSGYPYGWISANLTAQSQLFGRIINSSTNTAALLYNRSNLLGVIQPLVDDYILAISSSYGSIYPNYYYCETTILITSEIKSLRFRYYNIMKEYPPRQTGHIKAFIYALDANNKPSDLLYTSVNEWDVTDWNYNGNPVNAYQEIDFIFNDCIPNQRIAVGYAFVDWAGTDGYIGWLVKQTTQQLEPYGSYRYGQFLMKNLITGLAYNNYGDVTDFGSTIVFEKKSLSGEMIDRAAFIPQINFIN